MTANIVPNASDAANSVAPASLAIPITASTGLTKRLAVTRAASRSARARQRASRERSGVFGGGGLCGGFGGALRIGRLGRLRIARGLGW